MAQHRLTARTVAAITKRGFHTDGFGLVLAVSK